MACRYTSSDGELYKDVEGVIEGYCGALAWLQEKGVSMTSAHLVPVLELWDGVCCLFEKGAKPANWLGHVLRALKLFSAESRTDAVSLAEVNHLVLHSRCDLSQTFGKIL